VIKLLKKVLEYLPFVFTITSMMSEKMSLPDALKTSLLMYFVNIIFLSKLEEKETSFIYSLILSELTFLFAIFWK